MLVGNYSVTKTVAVLQAMNIFAYVKLGSDSRTGIASLTKLSEVSSETRNKLHARKLSSNITRQAFQQKKIVFISLPIKVVNLLPLVSWQEYQSMQGHYSPDSSILV